MSDGFEIPVSISLLAKFGNVCANPAQFDTLFPIRYMSISTNTICTAELDAIAAIRREISDRVSPSRKAHIERVTALLETLAGRFGIDVESRSSRRIVPRYGPGSSIMDRVCTGCRLANYRFSSRATRSRKCFMELLAPHVCNVATALPMNP